MKKSIFHAALGSVAILIIATFWLSTILSEIFLSHEAVILVKHSIVYYGLIPLVLTMAFVGISGNVLGKNRKGQLIEKKKKRMPFIALNGLLIMIPSALFLNYKATNNEFDHWFYLIQTLELLIGLLQLTLLTLNFRDGLKLSGRLRHPS